MLQYQSLGWLPVALFPEGKNVWGYTSTSLYVFTDDD
jgi:hypothetical protein